MIDYNFITRYTNALYTVDRLCAPTYDEFRDMFSSGQLKSKEWLVKELEWLGLQKEYHNFLIAGAWYGTLGLMIRNSFRNSKIRLLDIDPRCKIFNDKLFWDYREIESVTEDMYNYKYTEDIVINTSCEHIPDVNKWLDCIPKRTTVVLQTNNFFEGHGHINCVNNIDEFLDMVKLSEVLYSGKLLLPMYSRFMIVGTV